MIILKFQNLYKPTKYDITTVPQRAQQKIITWPFLAYLWHNPTIFQWLLFSTAAAVSTCSSAGRYASVNSIYIWTVSSLRLLFVLLQLHTVSFDGFLSGLEWILNSEFGLLKLLIFYQKLLWNIRSWLKSSTFWVVEPACI